MVAQPDVVRARTADGTSLAVRRLPGEGNLVVVLHGFTGDGSTMVPLAEACRQGRPAMLIDLVGHGQSDAPESIEPYMMASVVDQVLSLIGPHEPGTVHVVGYSLGGRVALSMAARAPWYFASVTTLSSTPGILDPKARAARYDADQLRADELIEMGLPSFVDEWLAMALFAPYVSSLTSQELHDTIAQRTSASARGLANSLRGTGTGSMPPVWQSLPALRTPLLAIAGSLDKPYVEIAHRMAEAAPFASAHVLANTGHVVHQENCDEVVALVASFLEVCESNADN